MLLLFACSCNNRVTPETPDNPAPGTGIQEPQTLSYQVVAEYPHDTGAYTQGLLWHNGQLVEGTGQLEESNVRKVDLKSGKVLAEVKNAPNVFGEGVTILNGKLYQITWQNRVGYVYDAATLKKEKEFSLPTAEGWGLTHNGAELIMSDGSSNLYFLNPETLREQRRLGVYDHLGPKGNLNELEYAQGYIYANQYLTDYILKIDPESGRVVARANLADLRSKAGIAPMGQQPGGPDVLNGIAYDSATQRFFITGKYWPKLFEVKFQ